jgi:hypothetical protein
MLAGQEAAILAQAFSVDLPRIERAGAGLFQRVHDVGLLALFAGAIDYEAVGAVSLGHSIAIDKQALRPLLQSPKELFAVEQISPLRGREAWLCHRDASFPGGTSARSYGVVS